MDKDELQWLAAKVETIVEDLKTARSTNKRLSAEKKRLEEKLASMERQIRQAQKEGNRVSDLAAENKAYRKKCALLKSKVTSMLAKAEVLQ